MSLAEIGRARQLAFAILGTLLALGLAETVARGVELLVPPIPVDATLGFEADTRLFVRKAPGSDELVTNPKKLEHFREQTFRGDKPEGTYRIVAVGESSVYRAQPELEILRKDLETAFQGAHSHVEVINAGGNSYGSHRLALLIQELVDYRPDLVLLYVGHNEFEEVEQLELAETSLRLLPILRVAERFALFRETRDLANRWDRERRKRAQRQHRLASREPNFGAEGGGYEFTKEDVDRRMASYAKNLRTIVEASRGRGATVIIGSVPSNLVKPILPAAAAVRYRAVDALFEAGRHSEGLPLAREILRTTAGRHQSSDLENTIIRTLASDRGVPLADVEAAVIEHEPHGVPGYTLFEDHCHLNDRGVRLWRLTYERVIAEVLRPTYPSAASTLSRSAGGP